MEQGGKRFGTRRIRAGTKTQNSMAMDAATLEDKRFAGWLGLERSRIQEHEEREGKRVKEFEEKLKGEVEEMEKREMERVENVEREERKR